MQGPRFEQRKKRRVNRMLNIAIGIVVILILIFGAQILFNSSSNESANEEGDDVTTDEANEGNTIPDPIDKDRDDDKEDDEFVESPNKPIVDEDEDLDQEEDINLDEDLEDEELEPVPDGEWTPVGTKQEGEFSHDFSKESQNWSEMTRALRYATGLDDSMIVWRLENGGSQTKARGVVSAPNEQEQPYEVYIEWVDGEGWLPVEKKRLDTNPYRR